MLRQQQYLGTGSRPHQFATLGLPARFPSGILECLHDCLDIPTSQINRFTTQQPAITSCSSPSIGLASAFALGCHSLAAVSAVAEQLPSLTVHPLLSKQHTFSAALCGLQPCNAPRSAVQYMPCCMLVPMRTPVAAGAVCCRWQAAAAQC